MKSSNTVNNLFLTGCFISFLSSAKQKVSSNWNDKILLNEITISEIQDGYENRIYSVREITTLYLDRIQKIDYSGPELNSLLITNPDALDIADSLDQLIKIGKNTGALFGIPIVLKDNINTADKMPTTGDQGY